MDELNVKGFSCISENELIEIGGGDPITLTAVAGIGLFCGWCIGYFIGWLTDDNK